MPSYPQKRLVVNNYHYLYIYILRVNHKTFDGLDLPNKQPRNVDILTSLPNWRMFNEHLRKEMKKADRSQLPMSLVYIDLDYFKEINDILDHDKGDLLLKEMASRL